MQNILLDKLFIASSIICVVIWYVDVYKKKYDVASLNLGNAGTYDVMTVFCVNKFLLITAA